MILFFAYGNLTQTQVLNSMRLFAEEVMPEFADASVTHQYFVAGRKE
jgi:hypothetical protein